MATKGYSAFPKSPASLEPHRQIVLVSYPGHSLGVSYTSAELQSVYSTAPAEAGQHFLGQILVCVYTICEFGQILISLHNYQLITFSTLAFLFYHCEIFTYNVINSSKMYAFTDHQTLAECDTRSIFKKSSTCERIQNFHSTGPVIVLRLKPSLPNYLSIGPGSWAVEYTDYTSTEE